jgi:hypothetical protein
LATKLGWRHAGLWIDLVFLKNLRRVFEALRWVSNAHVSHRLAFELSSADFNERFNLKL